MQNKFLATWIIAAFLFGVMAVFSVLTPANIDSAYEGTFASTDDIIHSSEVSALAKGHNLLETRSN